MKTLKKVLLMIAIFTAVVLTSSISNATTVRVTGDTLNVRKEASTSSEIIAMLSKGVECELLGEEGDFYKVKYENYTGYISKQYAEKVGETNSTSSEKNNSTNGEEQAPEENTAVNEENTTNQQIVEEQTSNSEIESTNNSTEKTLPKNTEIKILPLIYSSVLEKTKSDITVKVITEINGWSYIQTDEINGWVRTDKIGTSSTNSSKEDNKENSSNSNKETDYKERTGYINEEYVNVRSGASTADKIIKVLTLNMEVTITGEEGDWYKVKSGEDIGYVSKEFISDRRKETVSRSAEPRTVEDSKKEENAKTENISNKETSKTSNSKAKGEDVVAYAKKYLGYPYVYGAAGSSSFDCSGFTMYVYKHFGINLPHGATSQSKYGTKVSKANLKAGDIVFLTDYETGSGIGHCGIYVGSGNFIHASTTGYKVKISSLDGEYAGRFYSAIRLL